MSAQDSWSSYAGGGDWPASYAFAVTPSDSADVAYMTRGLYLGGAGNVTVVMAGGGTITFTGLAAGVIHPLRVVRVKATGTTATGIVGVY